MLESITNQAYLFLPEAGLKSISETCRCSQHSDYLEAKKSKSKSGSQTAVVDDSLSQLLVVDMPGICLELCPGMMLMMIFKDGYIIMPDPKHTSRKAQEVYNQMGINWWKTLAESPDINPVENLWTELKNILPKKSTCSRMLEIMGNCGRHQMQPLCRPFRAKRMYTTTSLGYKQQKFDIDTT
uniref:Tc1-like transposase DDE domain-containing protein n=1 Tax=Romanomermis culicivorax TaxID=13658 RepID=A0A915L7J5_ROMCU